MVVVIKKFFPAHFKSYIYELKYLKFTLSVKLWL